MKIILTGCAMLAGTIAAKGQTGMCQGKWENNDVNRHTRAAANKTNHFISTEMNVNNGIVSFSGLPDLGKTYCAMITNGAGEFIRQKRISPAGNQLDVSRLSRGLYFVTLVYKSKGQKTFVMNL